MMVVAHPGAVNAGILVIGIDGAGHHGGRDIGTDILARCPGRDRQQAEPRFVAGQNNLLAGCLIDGHRFNRINQGVFPAGINLIRFDVKGQGIGPAGRAQRAGA